MFYKIPVQKAIEVEPQDKEGDNMEALIIDHHDYVDIPEPIPKGKGGRPGDPRLVNLAIRCHKKDDPKKVTIFRCVGTAKGCTTAFSKSGPSPRFKTQGSTQH